MNRRRKRAELDGGHDSFLDIVANLVGILIILVVILGARSHQIASQIEDDTFSEAELAKAEQEATTFKRVSSDTSRLETAIRSYDKEIEFRKKERLVMLSLLESAKEKWQETLETMDDQEQRVAELVRKQELAKSELSELRGQVSSWRSRPDKVVSVDHLPTPMAKTVFSNEVHFRLKDGHLALVPIEELLDEVKEDVQRVANARTGGRKSSVGPIREFVARYNLQLTREVVSRGGQVGMMGRVELAELLIEPLREPIGEPLAEALRADSQLSLELAGRNPGATTVTVWVYPESFGQFRTLKEHLYNQGFATAGRPMPKGYPIAASPSGSRSQSQ